MKIRFPVYASGSDRVNRGGSWFYDPVFARVARRRGITPEYRRGDLGFHIILIPDAKCPER